MVHHGPLQGQGFLLRSCLVDVRRMLFFMVEQVFLLMGVCSMSNADTQCTVLGERIFTFCHYSGIICISEVVDIS